MKKEFFLIIFCLVSMRGFGDNEEERLLKNLLEESSFHQPRQEFHEPLKRNSQNHLVAAFYFLPNSDYGEKTIIDNDRCIPFQEPSHVEEAVGCIKVDPEDATNIKILAKGTYLIEYIIQLEADRPLSDYFFETYQYYLSSQKTLLFSALSCNSFNVFSVNSLGGEKIIRLEETVIADSPSGNTPFSLRIKNRSGFPVSLKKAIIKIHRLT